MEAKIKKPKRGNYIVQTPDRSYKDNTLLFTRSKTTTNVCQSKYTVNHILIECPDLAHIKKTLYTANNMKELFQNTETNNEI